MGAAIDKVVPTVTSGSNAISDYNGDGSVSGIGNNYLLSLLPANASNDTYKYWDVNASDDTYLGAFRLPQGNHGGSDDDFNYAHTYPSIAVHSTNKMFVAGKNVPTYDAGVAEVTIPTLSQGTDVSNINTATISQNFFNIRGSAASDNGEWGVNGSAINGMCVVNGRLMVSYYALYDTEGPGNPLCNQNFMVLDGLTLEAAGLRGFFTGTQVAHYTGWISPVPSARQIELDCTHLCGNTSGDSRSINNRNSMGPSLFKLNMNASGNIASASPPANGSAVVPTPTAILDYSLANPLTPIADMVNAGEYYTHLSEGHFGMIVPGTRTYMVLGFSGGHTNGTTYGTPPWGGYQGFYPIVQSDVSNYYWLYDLDEILSATNVYDPVPYEHGAFNAKFEGQQLDTQMNNIRGGSFDDTNDILYLSIDGGDTSPNEESDYPMIIAYDLSGINT